MQNSQLDRLLKLAKRTGDRLIVTSNDGAEPVVILPLAEYEGMLDAMTFFRSEKGGVYNPALEEDQHLKGGFAQDTEAPSVGSTAEEAEDFDPVALERQVMAAMPQEEPSFVPVDNSPDSQSMAVEQETPRKPITRKINQVEDGGEERFYLEAV